MRRRIVEIPYSKFGGGKTATKKGDPLNPENFRPITLLSCMGKLFTAILNVRLCNYLEENSLLEENQAGFRQNYSTTDHIFTLHCIIEYLKFHKKKLFCSFIDFSKAFDSVWRVGLWNKLLKSSINGNFLRVIQSLYSNIKSCVSLNNEFSPFFGSFRGVRQGENLSPLLLSLFLNDMETYLFDKQNQGVSGNIETDDFVTFFKIIVLLYADDTIIVADNADALQASLNDFYGYCNTWNLTVNIEKTKIIIFGSRGNQPYTFNLGSNPIEIVDSYKYLGVFFYKVWKFPYSEKTYCRTGTKSSLLFIY